MSDFELDLILALLHKECAPELVSVLTKIFRIPYEGEIFLDGDKSTINKMIEKKMNNGRLRYLKQHNLVDDRQYGYWK